MTEEREMGQGTPKGRSSSPERKDSFFSSTDESDPTKFPLSILIKVTKDNGESLPFGEVKTELIEEIFQNSVGITPVDVLILNDQDVLVDLADGVSIIEVAMGVHGEGRWRNQDIRIGCVIAGRESLLTMEKEREECRLQKENLEKERMELDARERESRTTIQEDSIRMKNEFAGYQVQMQELMMRVTDQLNTLEILRRETERKMRGERKDNHGTDERIDKLPSFPSFSGTESTPKDECSIETFLFQVRGARKNLMDQAVRAALISSLRGGASAFIEYVGLDSPLDFMIDELVERYCVTATHDTLVCEFHQLSQEQGECIREFAGRIEKVFKNLQRQIPERYPDKLLLKDRLFYGMNQHLKDTLRYLYTQSSVTYANLLQAAYAAEMEAEKGRAARSKAANLATSPDKVDLCSRDPSPIAASVAAIESKLDKCLKAVSKAAQAPANKVDSSKPKNLKKGVQLSPNNPHENQGSNGSQQGLSKGGMGNPFAVGDVEDGATPPGNVPHRET